LANKTVLAIGGIALCAFLSYIGLQHKSAIFSLFGKVLPSKVKMIRGIAGKSQSGEGNAESGLRMEKLQDQQEKIARTLAEQQAIAQQIQRASMQSVNDTQRTLRAIQEINRMNRANQELQRQVAPPR